MENLGFSEHTVDGREKTDVLNYVVFQRKKNFFKKRNKFRYRITFTRKETSV